MLREESTMIDEIKIKRELSELISKAPEGSFEKKIFEIILEYINRQPVITMAQIRFRQRMAIVVRLAVKMHRA